jgi:hypothetical protein
MQMAAAAARNARKVARAPVPVAQHVRDAFGSVDWPSAALSDYSNYNKRHGLYLTMRTCDQLNRRWPTSHYRARIGAW